MDQKERRKQILAGMLQARAAGDLQAFGAQLTETTAYHLLASHRMRPPVGSHYGRTPILQALHQVDIEFECFDHAPDLMIAEGDRIALRWHSRWRSRGTGAVGIVEGFANVLFRDLEILEIESFINTGGLIGRAREE